MKPNAGDKWYQLEIRIPADYPNVKPIMLLSFPKMEAESIFLKAGHASHTLSSIDDYPQICHQENWTADTTLYNVLLKGRIWVEAYENYLVTGIPIGDFVM